MNKIKTIWKSYHFQSLLSQGLNSVFGFASFILLAKFFTKEEFGNWIFYITCVVFVEMLRSGIVQTALIKFISGGKEADRNEYIGSSWLLNLGISLVILIVFQSVNQFDIQAWDSISYFLTYYPLLGFVILPMNYTLWILQADMKFLKITQIRLFLSGMQLIAIGLVIFFSWGLQELIWLHLLAHVLTSILCLLARSTYFSTIANFSRAKLTKMLSFGKYHVLSFLGTNLLKSADTFIIGIFMGPAAVALYNVPLKLLEIFEIPLRSAVSTALPQMSSANNNNEDHKVKSLFYEYSGILSILFIPLVALMFLFAESIILFIGGVEYLDSVIIFKVFLIYTLFLSLDRMTGVALISLNLPQWNLIKVVFMAGINILGDVVVLYFGAPLWSVAFVTVANILVGVAIGYFILKSKLRISLTELCTVAYSSLSNQINKRKVHGELINAGEKSL